MGCWRSWAVDISAQAERREAHLNQESASNSCSGGCVEEHNALLSVPSSLWKVNYGIQKGNFEKSKPMNRCYVDTYSVQTDVLRVMKQEGCGGSRKATHGITSQAFIQTCLQRTSDSGEHPVRLFPRVKHRFVSRCEFLQRGRWGCLRAVRLAGGRMGPEWKELSRRWANSYLTDVSGTRSPVTTWEEPI